MNKVKKVFAVIFAAMALMLMQTAVWANITASDYTDTATGTSGKKLTLSGKVTPADIYNYADKANVLYVMGVADTEMPTDCHGMFSGYSNLRYVDLQYVKEYHPTTVSSMFAECSKLAWVKFGDQLKTENVTDMSNMFSGCSSLTALDLTGFDTSKVKSMNSMFYDCEKLTTIDFDDVKTSSLEDMGFMFGHCTSLTSLDLSSFDTRNVNDMNNMFRQCYKLKELDLGNFDTRNVTTMVCMFFACSELEYIDMSEFSVSNNTDISNMFDGCNKLGSIRLGESFKNITNKAYLPANGGWISESGNTSATSSDGYAVINNTKDQLWINNNYINSFIGGSNGSGTQDDPIIISDYAKLRRVITIYDKFKKEDVYLKLSADDEIREDLDSGYEPIEITGGETVYLDVNGEYLIQGSLSTRTTDSMFYIKSGKMVMTNSISRSTGVICSILPKNAASASDISYTMFRVDRDGELEINSGIYNANYLHNSVIETTPKIYHKSSYDTEYEVTNGCPEGALKINGGEFYTQNEALLSGGVINGGTFHGSYRFSDREESNGVFTGYRGASGRIYNMKILDGILIHKGNDYEVIDQNSGVKVDGVLKTKPYNSVLTGNEIIVARYYTVAFDTNGRGTAPAAQNVFSGETASEPTKPTASGAVFLGWYTRRGSLYDFSVPVTCDMTLYAKWQGDSTVTFDVGDGMGISPAAQYIPAGGKAVCPDDPVYIGYVFMGWYNGDTKFDFNSEVTEDTVLQARWYENESAVTLSARTVPFIGAYYGDPITLTAHATSTTNEYVWEITLNNGDVETVTTSTKTYTLPAAYRAANTQISVKVTAKQVSSTRPGGSSYDSKSLAAKIKIVPKPGDMNNNGIWEKADARLLLKGIAGSNPENISKQGETNNDGKYDMLDVIAVLQRTAA